MRFTWGFLSILLLLSQSSWATGLKLEPWVGEKFIYSTDVFENELAMKIQLNAADSAGKVTGTLTIQNGTAPVQAIQNGEALKIETLSNSIKRINTEYNYDPTSGTQIEVEVESTLTSLSLEGDSRFLTVVFTDNICRFEIDSVTRDRKALGCSINSNPAQSTDAVMRDSITPMPLNIVEGDTVAVPVMESSTKFPRLVIVELGASGSVTSSKGFSKTSTTFMRFWQVNNDKLILTDNNGVSYSYQVIREEEGVLRTFAEESGLGQNLIYMGAMMVDEKVDLSNKSNRDMQGSYRSVQAGVTARGYNLVYDFDADGFGGFMNHFFGEDEYYIWQWEFANEKLVATRYYHEGVGMPTDRASLQACLNDTSNCFGFQKRSFKFLAQDGNRYVMLREMTMYDFATGDPKDTDYSLWVMYKK